MGHHVAASAANIEHAFPWTVRLQDVREVGVKRRLQPFTLGLRHVRATHEALESVRALSAVPDEMVVLTLVEPGKVFLSRNGIETPVPVLRIGDDPKPPALRVDSFELV